MLTEDVLELLKDGRWHDVSEVVNTLNRPEETIEEVLRFYEKFDFIQFDGMRKKILIDPKIRELVI